MFLTKPYEISVWDDIWNSTEHKFVEQRIAVIGTNEMISQNKVIEPILTRNVNGIKKLSFKMYKRYIDSETGEEIINPFMEYLINERKIKLKYGIDDEGNDKWYDFIIKNVNETSTTYLYQFDLEDAIVQELSKNGFGMTLDAQLNNNTGTADQLAEKVLADTDWTVGGSDKLVQEVKEHLVYVSYIQDPQPETLKIYQLKNSGDNYVSEGVEEVRMNDLELKGKQILAFYSSCTGKPHRFQFIILPDYIETNEDNVIINKDCQYFIECNPENYTVEDEDYGFKLPTGWCVQDQGDVETDDKDTTVSYKYRGNRFGYAQQAIYLPKLDRYVNKYTNSAYKNADGTDKIIYGYVENEYVSPVLMTNLISNTEFKNTSGWKGVGYGAPKQGVNKPESADKPLVENVYGTKEGNFESALDRLYAGTLGNDTSIYEAYMKLTYPKRQSDEDKGYVPAVINNGPFDNRTLIEKITEGDQWALYVEGRTPGDLTNLNFGLEESEYTSGAGCYVPFTTKKIDFSYDGVAGPQSAKIFTFTRSDYNEKTFKKQMKLRLVITHTGDRVEKESVHYIKTIELHKVVRDKDNNIIRLSTQANKIDEGVVNTKYFYFTEEAYNAATTKDEIQYIHTADKAEPSTFKPVYNAGAEKIRSVTTKESNYFNILQSIAETFEAWLDFKITRDANGAVTNKQVSFKKYSGGDNYAAFRYGVNLKDIIRTIESKQIVTKLIVKNNSNELAPNKFCTIQRAPSNVSGENYIYDFQYYHNNGLLDANDYLNELYYTEGAEGKDVNAAHINTNIKGYFPRLKALNNRLVDINDKMSGLLQELLQLKAEREVAEATYEAAESGIEQTSEDFETLTGFSITNYVTETVSKRSDINKLLTEYLTYQQEKIDSENEKTRLATLIDGDNGKQKQYDALNQQFEDIRDNQKLPLNKAFFQKYSRFIQEGTWIDEQYVDDEKYYNDAQTVLYNSCYPKVGYTINVLSLSKMPGYELFVFDVGEKTYVEDEEFFGTDENGYPNRTEIIITEMSEHLDNPSADSIKVQNFKNQFQDLFQKITATVQQTQYNEGTYRKGAALIEASSEKKNEFMIEALSNPDSVLKNAGLSEVEWRQNGITVFNKNNPSEALRLVSGGIMFSTETEGGVKWSTGITPQGISANKILAGSINTGEISLMNGKDTSFLWNAFGINAFDYTIENGTVVGVNKNKFVRFDRNGIYGVNGLANADTWTPEDLQEVDDKATFALTWEGLKVTGNDGVVAKIGKQGNKIIDITKNGENVFSITNNGATSITGTVTITKVNSSGPESTLGDTVVDSYVQYAYTEKESDAIDKDEWTKDSTPEGYNSIIHYLWSRTVNEKASGEITCSNPIIQLPPLQTFKVELSNENIWLPTDSDGDLVGDDLKSENTILERLTKMSAALYQGGTQITQGVSYSWSISGGSQVLTLSSNKGSEVYLQLNENQTSTSIPDAVEVGVVASYSVGGSKLDFPKAYFTITKVRGGAPGEYATVYEIKPETAAINISNWKDTDRFSVEVYKTAETTEPVTLSEDSNPKLKVVEGGDKTITYVDGVAKITIDTTKEKLLLHLIDDNDKANKIIDYETVSFVKNGDAGAVISCYIESTEGQLFEEGKDTATKLTARIFENNKEIDAEGSFNYVWYKTQNNKTSPISEGEGITFSQNKKAVTILTSILENAEVYFTATQEEKGV